MKPRETTKKKPRNRYTEEFKAGALRLVAEGRSPASVAHDLGLHSSSIYNWMKQAKVDAGKGPPGALTTSEREELTALRKQVRVLEMERTILKKAAAFFTKESA